MDLSCHTVLRSDNHKYKLDIEPEISKNMIRRIKLLLLALTASLQIVPAMAQQGSQLARPRIWLRADQPGTSASTWGDYSGHGYDAQSINGSVLPDTALFNYNRCYLFDTSSSKLQVNYIAPANAKVMVFSVYRPDDPLPEAGIWNLALDSGSQVRLSTQKLRNVYKEFQYDDTTATTPIINLLNQQWRNKSVDSSMSKLLVAGTDSLDYTGKFAEFMLFDTSLETNDIYKLHTYLGIKYGVSIRDMNYVLSNDSTLWDYSDNIDFKYDIAAIGKDSLIDVWQKQSAGNGGEAPLKIAAGHLYESNVQNPSIINEGDFLIWGNNGKDLSLWGEDTLVAGKVSNLLHCTWLLRTAGSSSHSISTQLVINSNDIPDDSTLLLVINQQGDPSFPVSGSLLFTPDSIDTTGNYYFNDIHWDPDTNGLDLFTFQVVPFADDLKSSVQYQDPGNEDPQNASLQSDSESGNAILDCSLFPNPTPGAYNITLRMNTLEAVEIILTDENGKDVERFTKQGSFNYILQGNLERTGCYFVTVKSKEQTDTYKLIVN